MTKETIKTADTYAVSIWVAGDTSEAERICRKFCMDVGLCVTVTPTAYVYSGGTETGVCVRLVNYPRFPSSPDKIDATAMGLARELRYGLCQWSVMVETPHQTTWLTMREERENG